MKRGLLALVASLVLIFPPLVAHGSTSVGSLAKAGQFCAPQKGAGGPSVTITWSTWGNPGELKRFQEFTDAFNKCYAPRLTAKLVPVPIDNYNSKILTEIAGGTAPDLFYIGAQSIGTFVDKGVIADLTSYLTGPMSKSKPEEFFPGLWSAAKTAGHYYGVPVDNNPMIMWYNKALLKDAGVTQMPETLVEQGKWSWSAFQAISQKVRAKGNYGYVLGNWDGHYYSWVTTGGGKLYANNRFVVAQDPKSVAAFTYLNNNLNAKNFVYQGNLPRGEGDDALFLAQKVAFVGAGRWYLPEFKQAGGLQFDIVPWPSLSGKLTPAYDATAYMVMLKATKHPKEAFTFLTNFVSRQGQIFRLQGGGNAVPSVKGADAVVLEGNLPAHAKYFLTAREVGYAEPATQARVAGLSTYMDSALENIWLKHKPVGATLNQIAATTNKMIAKEMGKTR
jgi:multiple sugar transport system substrate-binding protein